MIKSIEIDSVPTKGQICIKNLRMSLEKDVFVNVEVVNAISNLKVDFKVKDVTFTGETTNVYNDSYPLANIVNTTTSNTPKFSSKTNGAKLTFTFDNPVNLRSIAFDIPSATNTTSPWTLTTFNQNGRQLETFEVVCSNGEAMAKRQFDLKYAVRCLRGENGKLIFLREADNG